MRVSYQVVNEVGESPDHWDTEKWDAEEDHVQQSDSQDIRQPDAPAVHNPGIGVHFAVSCAHIHLSSLAPLEWNTEQKSLIRRAHKSYTSGCYIYNPPFMGITAGFPGSHPSR